MVNTNLHKAKTNKNDEFYTQLEDIEKELIYYQQHFKNKTVYCNCDDPTYSAFWKYFHLNFSHLELKKLICTHYKMTEPTYKMEYTGGDDNNIEVGTKTTLQGNGDFRSQECVGLLNEADIIVTNPPFSLFREYIALLMEYNKKFLVVGNINALTYKEVFPLIKDNKVWLGASIHSGDRKFYVPNDYPLNAAGCGIDSNGHRFIRVKGVRWYTNLDYKERHVDLETKYYFSKRDTLYPNLYPKYDNYNAINVDKTAEIPMDYYGIMGVPITFLDKYNPDQYQIIGLTASWDESDEMKKIKTSNKYRHNPIINGKNIYRRLMIKRKEVYNDSTNQIL